MLTASLPLLLQTLQSLSAPLIPAAAQMTVTMTTQHSARAAPTPEHRQRRPLQQSKRRLLPWLYVLVLGAADAVAVDQGAALPIGIEGAGGSAMLGRQR